MRTVRDSVGFAVAVATLSCGLASAPAVASAQEHPEKARIELGSLTFLPEIDVRLRGEMRNDRPDFARIAQRRVQWSMLSRARLGVAVERGFVAAKITLQDARALGNGPSPLTLGHGPPLPAFGPYEAFVEARSSAARPSFVRIGRQAVEWGEGRLLGVADFSPTGRSLDAARARAVWGNVEIEALGVLLAQPTFVERNAGDELVAFSRTGAQLAAARIAYSYAPLLSIELFGFARFTDLTPQGTISPALGVFSYARARSQLYTASLRISGRDDVLSYGVEGAVQGGDAIVEKEQPILAYSVAGHIDRRFSRLLWKPTLRVIGGYASGGPRAGKLAHFDPLLPDTQRWHGRFDLFGFSNLADVGGQIEATPLTDVTAFLGYRYAHLANADGEWIGAALDTIGAPGPGTSGALGHEMSFGLSVEPLPGFTLAASYSALVLGESAKSVFASRLTNNGLPTFATAAPDTTHYAFAEARVRFP